MKCLLDTKHSKFPDINHSNCVLVCMGIQALSKGVPEARATLSFPTEQDFDDLCSEMTDPYKYGLVSVSGPVEEKHWDPYRKERSVLQLYESWQLPIINMSSQIERSSQQICHHKSHVYFLLGKYRIYSYLLNRRNKYCIIPVVNPLINRPCKIRFRLPTSSFSCHS